MIPDDRLARFLAAQPRPPVVCPVCGATFERLTDRGPPRVYCTDLCRNRRRPQRPPVPERRWPLAPVLAFTHQSAYWLAGETGATYGAIVHPDGMSDRTADMVATGLGEHPLAFWPTWDLEADRPDEPVDVDGLNFVERDRRRAAADDRAIAYYTGGADARAGLPPRSRDLDYERGYVNRAGGWADNNTEDRT